MVNPFKALFKMFNPIYSGLLVYGDGQRVYPHQNFEDIAREGYSYNAEAYASIKKVYESTASIPLKLVKTHPNGEQETLTDHEILRLLAQPNPYQSGIELRESFVAFYCLSGNSFMQPLGIEESRKKKPLELHVWRPDKMFVIQGNMTRPIKGYSYEENGRIVTLAYDQIIHWRTWNPMEWWYGLAPTTAASYAIDLHSEYNKHNFNTVKRGARSPVYLKYEGKLLKKEQVEEIRDTFDSKYGGAENAGKTPVAHGGLELHHLPNMKPVEMDWIEGMLNAKRQINTVHGVPSELLNDADAKKYGNFVESRRAFYMETCIPLNKKMCETLNRGLVIPFYGQDLRLEPDIERIDGIQGDRAIVVAKVIDAFREGLVNREEGRSLLGLDPQMK